MSTHTKCGQHDQFVAWSFCSQEKVIQDLKLYENLFPLVQGKYLKNLLLDLGN